jgi:Mlc titration factor MtfA (ptsG expression regulator)
LSNEVRVIINAHTSLMRLELPYDYFHNVEFIYVYPTTVFYYGPVILVCYMVNKETWHLEHVQNVVYHEFTHKLDKFDGSPDGTPFLTAPEKYQWWHEVCSKEYLELWS